MQNNTLKVIRWVSHWHKICQSQTASSRAKFEQIQTEPMQMTPEPNLEPRVEKRNLSELRIRNNASLYTRDFEQFLCKQGGYIGHFPWNEILPKLKLISIKEFSWYPFVYNIQEIISKIRWDLIVEIWMRYIL